MSRAKVTVTSVRASQEVHTLSVLLTDSDGRYSGTIIRQDGNVWIGFEKDGYGYTGFSGTNPRHEDITLYRKVRWEEISLLPFRDAGVFDEGVRELFASEEWNREPEGKYGLLGFLFNHQDQFRPALAGSPRMPESVRVCGTGSICWEIRATAICSPMVGVLHPSTK